MTRRYGEQHRIAAKCQMRLFVVATGINCSGKACERFMGTIRIDPVTGQEVVNGKFARAFHGRTQLHPRTYGEIKKKVQSYGLTQVYDHALWELIGDDKITTDRESKGVALITELASEIKKICLAKDESLLKIGDIVATNNELDVIAAHILLFRSAAIKNRKVLVKLLNSYLSIVGFAIEWRSLRFIKEEFFYYMQNTFFDNPKTNLSFIIDSAYPDFKTASFSSSLSRISTINLLTDYFIMVVTKRSEKAKYRMRVYMQFIDIAQLIADLDFVHGMVDSNDTRNNSGLLALLAVTGNTIKVNAYRGPTRVINNSQKLPNGRLI